MTPDKFCYWLRGFLEMADPKELTETQTTMLKKHLALCFIDVTSEPVVLPDVVAPQGGVLTDSATDADRKERTRKTIQDAVERVRHEGFWDRGTTITCDTTAYCSPSISGRGAKLC